MNGLGGKIAENIIFVFEFALIVVLLVLIAYAVEKYLHLKQHNTERILSTRKISMIGLFSAVSAVLMVFDLPVPFAPPFYKIDLSELPVLVIAFAYGPVAGVMTEFVKILLKLVMKSTSTAFVGELANFAVGCTMVLPASILYLVKKSRRTAIAACVLGTLCMTVFASAFNAVYLLPKFAELYGMPLDKIIAMGTKINPSIADVGSMALYAVAPLNFLKGTIDTLFTLLLYKRLSPILKSGSRR